MSEATIRFDGLNEFMQRLTIIADEYPKTAEKHLRIVGNKLRKLVIAKTPRGKMEEEYKKRNRKGEMRTYRSKRKLYRTWKSQIIGFRGHSLEYQLRSVSKRFHLVERGHAIVSKNGRLVGFVQGKFFLKTAVEEFQNGDDIKRQLEKFAREIKKKAGG